VDAVIAATALAPTALAAEALAKAALLSGPGAGRRLLRARYGGVLLHDDGAVDPVDRRRRLAPSTRAQVAVE
jgi:hypothetical protein